MEWVGGISEAIRYMEEHLTEELTVAQITKHTLISPLRNLDSREEEIKSKLTCRL